MKGTSRARGVLALAVLLGACACGAEPEGTPETDVPQQAADSGALSEEEVDRLRALGYAGYAPEAATSQDGAVMHDAARSWPGYNLALNYHLASAELFRNDGEVVHAWNDQGGLQWNGVLLLPGGDLIVVGSSRTPGVEGVVDAARYVMRIAWDGTIVWKRPLRSHHSLSLSPSGEIVVLTFAYRRERDLDPEVDVRDDHVTLLSLDGEPIEERSIHGVFGSRPDRFELHKAIYRTLTGRTFIDLYHTNTAEWMRHEHLVERHPLYALDNVLVTLRNQDAIGIFTWSTGELLWSWGQDQILGPHDATVLEDGNILLLDNGLGRGWSRLLEIDPTQSEIIWEHRAATPADFYTSWGGTSQRLPNGNTLVTCTATGTAFEVTRNHDVVWEYFSPHRNALGNRATIVRLKRYPEEYVARMLAQTRSKR